MAVGSTIRRKFIPLPRTAGRQRRLAPLLVGMTLGILLGIHPAAGAPDTPATTPLAPEDFPRKEQVASLIAELGKSRYVTRRMAEQKLLEIGMEAFDQIDAATDHPDPEIAASCKYLLSQMTVRWTRRDDPPQVTRFLSGYADQDEDDRQVTVSQLESLPDNMGLPALCRICRYDPSPLVSRAAAVAVMDIGEFKVAKGADEARLMREAMGSSVRPAAHWVRLFAVQIESPEQAVKPWNEAVDRELQLADAPDADEELAGHGIMLLWNLVRLHLQQGNEAEFLEVAQRVADRNDSQFNETVEWLAKWTGESETPQLLDKLLAQFEEKLSTSRGGLYLMAMARADQGKDEEAKELADAAFAFQNDDVTEDTLNNRNLQARELLSKGHVEWGRRELREVVEKALAASQAHVVATYALADSLHDSQEDKEAAELLGNLTKVLRDRIARDAYETMRQEYYYFYLPEYEKLLALEYYYQACHLKHQEGDTKAQQWLHLNRAVKYDSENADVLIALYHASEGSETHRKQALTYIERRCRQVEQEIESNPENFNSYNEWAWLVSNTEGDFEKAIRYSQQSIKLYPDGQNDGGLLDTLAVCYFAAGDIDKAIEIQTKAVEKMPHTKSLERQLEKFKRAKAEQTAGENET